VWVTRRIAAVDPPLLRSADLLDAIRHDALVPKAVVTALPSDQGFRPPLAAHQVVSCTGSPATVVGS